MGFFYKKEYKLVVFRRVMMMAACLFLAFSSVLATSTAAIAVSGRVVDSGGEPMIGVSVVANGAATATDENGAFSMNVPDGTASLTFSFVGFVTQTVSIVGRPTGIEIVLLENGELLDEVVVIGYGTAKKSDLTGAVTAISSKDFNTGPIVSAQQLISGKVAGVQITSNGGAPGAGARIRIRGGSSLNASNDPLIVVDGVPLDNNGISGSGNALSLINPNDIESFNILKDASATAIYGARASNGVIIITTKKGTSDKLHIELSTLHSYAIRTGGVDVLSAAEFKSVIDSNGTASQRKLIDTTNLQNTDWQNVIYRAAYSHDNNVSFSGGIKGLPYRLSLGYMNQNGILRTDNLQRTSVALNLNPMFMQDHLAVNLNFKGSQAQSHFADQGAIGSAVFFDPTKPVYAPTQNEVELGGYYEWLDPATHKPNTLAVRNPLSLLEQKQDNGTVQRSIGNVQLDYKLPFLPNLHANLNVGYDFSKSEGTVVWPATAAAVYNLKGTNSQYSQTKFNKLLEYYMRYAKELKNSNFDLTAGYTYQDWVRENPAYPTVNGTGTVPAGLPYKTQNTLVSFFGRANYSIANRYLLTATVRRDGSSRFSPDNRWGTFPSVAFAWKIGDEGFLRENRILTDLKLRIGYGITGQQDIGSDYPYLARYTVSDSSAMYQLGNQYYFTLRPEGYDANIKWEETATYNAGLDFGFLENRITFSADAYFKKTKDLLAFIPVPIGSNLTNGILTNVGNIENRGVELSLSAAVINTKNFRWDANFNATFNKSTITNLSKVQDETSIGVLVGGISGGVGNNVQIHTVDYSPYSFYVYEQTYDEAGKPIEGVYVDRNADGVVNESDKYRYQSPDPSIFLGFSSNFAYKKLTFGFVTRANLGNYVYNNVNSSTGSYQSFGFPNYLGNMSANVLETKFKKYQYWSDYYVENASFLKVDNISLGYNVGKLTPRGPELRLSANVQNAFIFSNYSGLDPERAGGIDNNFYPNPRTYSLGANFRF